MRQINDKLYSQDIGSHWRMSHLDALKEFALDVCNSATSYKVDQAGLEKILSYDEPVKISSGYSKSGKITIRCRSIAGRSNKKNPGSTSLGEFYKNTILGMVRDLPVYNGKNEWIDVESFQGEIDFTYNPIPLKDRCLSDPSSLVFGSDESSNHELKFAKMSEFMAFSDSIRYEAFGNDSFCKIHSLVEMVKQCHAITGKQVLVVELGPGVGFWINRIGSILHDLNVPFLVLSLEYYFFNAVNTMRMAKYFGNNDKIISLMADIHDFDWSRFCKDFTPISHLPIVLHSSGCLNYVNSSAIANMLFELSKFNLYGGCHYEGDAFTLYDCNQKRKFLDTCLRQPGILYPMPELGMDKALRKKAGVNQLSYMYPSFRSSIISAIEKFHLSNDLEVKTIFPWSALTCSPFHYTEWKIKQ